MDIFAQSAAADCLRQCIAKHRVCYGGKMPLKIRYALFRCTEASTATECYSIEIEVDSSTARYHDLFRCRAAAEDFYALITEHTVTSATFIEIWEEYMASDRYMEAVKRQ